MKNNNNFRRNHWFPLETWEGMFRAFLLIFLKEKGYDVDDKSLEQVVKEFNRCQPFQGTPREAEQMEAELLARVKETLHKAGVATTEALREDFLAWGEQRAAGSKT